DADIARQEIGQDLALIGLGIIDRTFELWRLAGARHRWDELHRGRRLRDHRFEPGKENRANVKLALVEQCEDLGGDHLRMGKAQYTSLPQIDDIDDQTAVIPPQDVETFLADAENLDRLALCREAVGMLARELDDR